MNNLEDELKNLLAGAESAIARYSKLLEDMRNEGDLSMEDDLIASIYVTEIFRDEFIKILNGEETVKVKRP